MTSPLSIHGGPLRQDPRSPASLEPPTPRCLQYAYLDLSNISIGAAHVSAARLGLATSPSSAAERGICDPALRLNFAALRQFTVGTAALSARTVCVGSIKVDGDCRISSATHRAGWLTDMHLRAKSGREKLVDTGLSVLMLEDLFLTDVDAAEVEVTLLSGDRDLLPAVKALKRRGFSVDVMAWQHTISDELKQAARRFISLDENFQFLTFRARSH